jgi:hypothetical protein
MYYWAVKPFLSKNLSFICAKYTPNFTNSMGQSSSWERRGSPLSQKIICILWKSRFHYRADHLPPVPTLSQINPVHALPSDFFKTHSNINPHLHLRLPNGLFLSGFPTKKNPVWTNSFPIRTTCPTNLILDFITWIIFGEKYRSIKNWLPCTLLQVFYIEIYLGLKPALPVSCNMINPTRNQHLIWYKIYITKT